MGTRLQQSSSDQTAITSKRAMAKVGVAILIGVTLFGVSSGECNKDTGGTCNAWGCDSSRNAQCVDKGGMWNNKCLCSDGFCAQNGGCVRETSFMATHEDRVPSQFPLPPALMLSGAFA